MNRDHSTTKPELMSPAGYWPQLEAAIDAGADAVYFGLQHFTARAKVGFSIEELPSVLRKLHRHAVKGFVTFNTLVFDHELKQAREAIESIAQSGADAIIVQDIGIAKMAQQIAPELAVHGSTQMSVTSAEGVELAASLGCSRVVLGRELSIKDIRKIASATEVELETFVHGALCVSYSGQCFSSEAWGGRSANRGKCAQACRLSYDLIVDGQQRDLGEFRYLLSPGDLFALEQIPELIEIGVSCFKIEGRYKGTEYVTLTTRAYREAIDKYFGENNAGMSVGKSVLEQVYSRGLGAHFVSGIDHQNVVNGRAPRHRGVKVGTVDGIERGALVVAQLKEIRPGDGLVVDSANWRSPDEKEEGGNVYEVETIDDENVRLRFGHGEFDFTRIRVGDWVWRTSQPAIQKTVKKILSTPKTTGLRFVVDVGPREPLRVTAESRDGCKAIFESDQLLEPAVRQSISEAVLTEQFSRLGDTPFHLDYVSLNLKADTFCPVSLLNRARRELVVEILACRENRNANRAISDRQLVEPLHATSIVDDELQLHVLVRNAEQLSAAIKCRPSSITLDYLELYGLRPSVERIADAGISARVASPRILKPSEQKVVRFLLSLESSLLVRSGGLLHDLVTNPQFEGRLPDLHGDFSLNAANALAFQSYLEMGLSRITPTYDLNENQIVELGSATLLPRLEVVAYQHLPVFHTEHCVFCRFLSDGTDNTNCGHPCEKHRISVRDKQGRRHPVLADVGCRNTVFGAEAQFSPTSVDHWIKAGVKHFRIEYVHQSAEQVETITHAFTRFLKGKIELSQFDRMVASQSDQGVAEGSLFVPKDYKNLVQLS